MIFYAVVCWGSSLTSEQKKYRQIKEANKKVDVDYQIVKVKGEKV